MSIVPNNTLESADSLVLQTFGINLDITAAQHRIDIYTRYLAYWKSLVIRNTQPIDSLTYRTEPNGPLFTVQPNSELPIQGWGSYLEINSAAATPAGRVEFVCVNIREATRRKQVA